MRGINTNVGAWQPGLMWTAGDSRLLTEWYGSMLVRFRYFAIQPDSVSLARRCHVRSRQDLDHGLLDDGGPPHLAVTSAGTTLDR